MLELRNVNTVYGEMPVLNNVTLQVRRGETVCILGANGAGKTTLLKTILGLVKPVTGSVHFLGERIDGLPIHHVVRKGIAIVPEREGLFPDLPVEKNLLLGAYHEGNKNIIEERLEHIYELFPRLKERKRQRAGTLSGGERKMLYIARALLADPKLILLDEPSLGLAPAIVNEVFAMISRIKKENQITFILVEQNARKALRVSERGYVLQKGQIVYEGTTDEMQKSTVLQQSYLGTAS
ncbi:MAG: ABC transporter ATP-binding protein [Clostridia bacterium]|nr:ABC transporter ATP-binding protein [Clostridia bacterium]